MLWLLTAAFIELLDALFNELFDAVFVAFLAELLDAVFLELLVDNFAATTLPREPPLLTNFDLEEVFAAETFARLVRRRLGGLRLRWRGRLHLAGPLHCRFLGLVHSGRRFAALSRLGF